MQYRYLGKSGLRISNLALGSWLTYGSKVDVGGTRSCIDAALDAGVNFIDTADVYSFGDAEKVLGRALEGRARSHLVLATKCFFPMSDDPNDRGLSRKHMVESADASLGRLRTDYIDLYQCHRFDERSPLAELVHTIGLLMNRGKILYWGVSCWSAEQIREVCRLCDSMGVPRPISNQPPYNLLERGIEESVVPASIEEGLGQVVFSPLAQGMLTGKYEKGSIPEGSRASEERDGVWLRPWMREEVFEAVDRVREVADELGTTLARLALAWCAHKPGIDSVVFGASSVRQVEENAAAAEVSLSDEAVERVEAAVGGVRL
ncbi:MAG: aldo/keto reductase [Gemmatimonadetes bacterium]|nr:aldo/keto reductase [Gemmatimonadota bacterium]